MGRRAIGREEMALDVGVLRGRIETIEHFEKFSRLTKTCTNAL
jgi:hypothetical protein